MCLGQSKGAFSFENRYSTDHSSFEAVFLSVGEPCLTASGARVHSPFEGGISCPRTPCSPRRHTLACAWTARQGGFDRVIRVAKGLS
jgi:hypothetical protein